jgi:hypothetical protein
MSEQADVTTEIKLSYRCKEKLTFDEITLERREYFPKMTGTITTSVVRGGRKNHPTEYTTQISAGDLKIDALDIAFKREARVLESAKVEQLKLQDAALDEEIQKITAEQEKVRKELAKYQVARDSIRVSAAPANLNEVIADPTKKTKQARWCKFINNTADLDSAKRREIDELAELRFTGALKKTEFWFQLEQHLGQQCTARIRDQWKCIQRDYKTSKKTTGVPSTRRSERQRKDVSPEKTVRFTGIPSKMKEPHPKRQRVPEVEEEVVSEYEGDESEGDEDEDSFEDWAASDVQDGDAEEMQVKEDSEGSYVEPEEEPSTPGRKKKETERYNDKAFDDGGKAPVENIVNSNGDQFEELKDSFFLVLNDDNKTWRDDFDTFMHYWKTNQFFKRAEELLLSAWKRGYEGEGQINTKKSFYELLMTNFSVDAPETEFQSNRNFGEGHCDACGGTKFLSCKFWPDIMDPDTFFLYGGDCGQRLDRVDTFMHWFRTMMREIRKFNRVVAITRLKKNQYWTDLVTPLDEIQSNQ